MKVFRDMCAAILLGTIGGFLVSTISYYNDNKEGGIMQTLLAVANSFDTVADAYSVSDDNDLLLDAEDYVMEDETLAVLGDLSEDELQENTDLILGNLLDGNDMEEDVLVMEEEDGGIEKGMPYSGIMRFHVRAHSDSREDQELKMAVKEDVVTFLKPLLEDCTSVAESKNVIVSNLQNLYTISRNTVVEQGYDYPIEVYVTEEEFPAKTYGGITFPEGKYQALRIDIGDAKGQNWWCVMYPPLCFIDETTAVVSEEGKEMLKENLSPQEYADLFANSEIKFESKIWNWLKGKK